MKLCCQGCGADLQVTEDVRFVTCNYCQSKLEIVRDTSTTHTRVLEKLERTTERLAGNLRVIELQNDLERMDREWEAISQGMMIRSRDGDVSPPSVTGAVITGVMATGMGLVWMIITISKGVPLFSLMGVAFVGVGIYSLTRGASQASDYRDMQQRHEANRRRMLALIEKERRR
ncbi:MAG TPA: hypothetical protein VIM57_07235 [Luteolibacter sp.]